MSFLDKMFYVIDKKQPRVPVVTEDGVLHLEAGKSLDNFGVLYTTDPELAKASVQNIYNNITDKDFALRELKRIYHRVHALEVKGKTGLFANTNNKVSMLNNKELMLLMPHLYSPKYDMEFERVTIAQQQKTYRGKKCVYVPIIEEGSLSAIERNNFIEVYLRPGTIDELNDVFDNLYDAMDKQMSSADAVKTTIRKAQIMALYRTLIDYQSLKKDDDLGVVDNRIYSILSTMLQANVHIKVMPNLKIGQNGAVEELEKPSATDIDRIEETKEEIDKLYAKLLIIYPEAGKNPQITPNFANGTIEVRNYSSAVELQEIEESERQ